MKKPYQITKKDYEYGEAFISLLLVIALATAVALIILLLSGFFQKESKSASQEEYAQQLEMLEYQQSEGRHNIP